MRVARATLRFVRSTPKLDEEMRARLEEAVTHFDAGSADAFGRRIGYTNGGYIRQVLTGKRPVREALIDRVHAVDAMRGWFDAALASEPVDEADAQEAALLSAFRGLTSERARASVFGYIEGIQQGAQDVTAASEKPVPAAVTQARHVERNRERGGQVFDAAQKASRRGRTTTKKDSQ